MTVYKVSDLSTSQAATPLFGAGATNTPRLKLFDFSENNQDTRFCVQAMTISRDTFFLKRWVQQLKAWLWYAQVGGDAKTAIFVKVNSLARRLLLDKKEIYQAVKAKTLNTLIAEQQKKIKEYLAIDNRFDTIAACGETNMTAAKKVGLIKAIAKAKAQALAHFTAKNGGKLSLDIKIENSHFGDVKEGASKSSTPQSTASKPSPEGYKFGDENAILTYEEEGQKFQFRALYTNKKVYLIRDCGQLQTMSKNFPHVYKVYDFISESMHIFKTNKPTSTGRAVDVEKEARILHEIHRKKNLKFVQPPPVATINSKYLKASLSPFLTGGDLKAFIDSKPGWAAIKGRFGELLDALKEFHEQERHHGDLKPQNILMCSPNLYFIDWETSRSYNEAILSDDFTPDYVCKEDFAIIEEAQKQKATASLTEITLKKQQNTLIAKIDVYAFGVILHQLVTGGKMPKFVESDAKAACSATSSSSKTTIALPNKIKTLDISAMQDADCTESVKKFIAKMLDADIHTRYTVEDAVRDSAKLTWQSLKSSSSGSKVSSPSSSAASTPPSTSSTARGGTSSKQSK